LPPARGSAKSEPKPAKSAKPVAVKPAASVPKPAKAGKSNGSNHPAPAGKAASNGHHAPTAADLASAEPVVITAPDAAALNRLDSPEIQD